MPGYGNHILDKGYDAAAAITKYRAVKLHATTETVTPVAASTDIVYGIAQNEVTTAELAKKKGVAVRAEGITEWEVAAAVTRGQEVMAAADGRATPATGATNRVAGLVLEGADAAGKRATVRLISGRII